MKTLITCLCLLTTAAQANSHMVCFPGKTYTDLIDRICFDRTRMDPKKTRAVSVNAQGVSEIEVHVFGLNEPLKIFATKSSFDKKTTWE